ncbi:MAG: hypothetical protein C0594_00740 [Marinilabiliales bacterium]|nr:MAG: hypothetical protein C0594_00740 [Marinilabiliales bacterium]
MAFILVLAGVIFYAFKMDFNQESIMHFGHYFEMFAIGAVFLFILVPNIARMWYFTVLKDKPKIKFGKYFKVLGSLFIHMFTQKQTLGCDESRSRWFLHLVLVFGYLTLLATTVALDWFGTDNSIIIALGYIEAFLVFSITIIFMLGRISKTREMSKFSQPSDIFFIVWLFLMGLTAFAVRLFIDLDLLTTNFWLYLAHLTILAQWAIIIVPFGKWTHFLYRSFAMYFEELKAQK